MQNNFTSSLGLTLKNEGGYTNDPRDPGNRLPDGRAGSTNLGVTQLHWELFIGKKVTQDDMRRLTADTVAPFYKKQYWDNCNCDDMPAGLDYCLFDFAVNAGGGTARRILQQSLGVETDGTIGPATLSKISESSINDVIDKFTFTKKEYYKTLRDFTIYGLGWIKRCDVVRNQSIAMIG